MEITMQFKFEDVNEAKQVLNSIMLGEKPSLKKFELTGIMLDILNRKNAVDSNSALYADNISTEILQDSNLSPIAKSYYIYDRGLPTGRVKTAMNQGIAASGRFLVRTGAVKKIGDPGEYKYYLA